MPSKIKGDLEFTQIAEKWGVRFKNHVQNGSAYADFDNGWGFGYCAE